MMQDQREQEIKAQFLDEAQEYLNTLEQAVLGIAGGRVDLDRINTGLRAAHSIKGGAAMMGFSSLSELTHRLENSLKSLKARRSQTIEPIIEELLLGAIDTLQRVLYTARQGIEETPDFLMQEIYSPFDQLYRLLGEVEEEDASSVLGSDSGQALLEAVFSSEVDEVLQRVEKLIERPDNTLTSELLIVANELMGLGEMLQLPAFSCLCTTIIEEIETGHAVETTAQFALNAWRQAQAMVLTQQIDRIPLGLDTSGKVSTSPIFLKSLTENLLTSAESFTQSPDHESDDDRTVRVSLKRLNQLNDLFGELTIERNALALYADRLRSLTQTLKQRVQNLNKNNQELRGIYDQISTLQQPIAGYLDSNGDSRLEIFSSRHLLHSNQKLAHSILRTESTTQPLNQKNKYKFSFDQLELDQYTNLSLLSQEVMESIVQVQEVTTDIDLSLEETDQTLRNFNKTSKQLTHHLTQLRMRPLADILDRFPRAVRDLCQEHGKRVRINMEGGQTLVDRNILESLQEPLMHLLRNAFDHGVESPEERCMQGKAEEGVIDIRAFQRGNQTLIQIQDDGRGINIERIRQRAIAMGLDPELLVAANERELLTLIFEPGFSTSDSLTMLSGRGIGMDVVRERLKQVRGEITIDTKPGQGTTFTLSIPFSLAVMRVLLVESDGILLAFPADLVTEVVLLSKLNLEETYQDQYYWNGHPLQHWPLSSGLVFNCPNQPYSLEMNPKINEPLILIVNLDQQPVGLQVDRSWGEQEVAVRAIESNIAMPAGLSSCTIMGDGRVVPLVNVSELLYWMSSRSHLSNRLHSELAPSLAQMKSLDALARIDFDQRPTVMVIDDSINVRRFLALTLEKAGYLVEQAKDGQDAINKLEIGLQVQAIICDIEMPRLDGYGVLTKLKSDPSLSHVPVAMLTSRSGEKHRQLAMRLGASAYLSKPYNEQKLLQKLEEMVQVVAV